MHIRVVILAAGQGKRMGSPELPKVLQPVLGRPMLSYVLDAVEASGVDPKPVVVIGYRGETVRDVCADRCDYAVQERLLGTGDAVRAARTLLEGDAEHVVVLNGDHPLVDAGVLRRIADTHLASGATLTIGTCVVEDFEGWKKPFADFGRIIRGADGKVARIVEARDASPDERTTLEVNPNIYCFRAAWLWPHLEHLRADNSQSEYYLTDLLAAAVAEDVPIQTVAVPPETALGVNTPEQLATAEEMMKKRH